MAMALLSFACVPEENNEKPQPVTSDPAKAPQVVATTPEMNDPTSAVVEEIVITYDKEIALAPNTTISVNGNYVDDVVYVMGSDLCIPVTLRGGTTYTVKVASPSVKDSEGNYSQDFSFSFTTVTRNMFRAQDFAIAEAPADPSATQEAKDLYAAMKANFGTRIYSAAMAEVSWNTDNAELIYQKTGKYPAINAFDYIHLPSSPSSWIDYGDITPVKDWVDKGGMVATSWHWLVPVSDPDYEPTPEPEYPDEVVIDFDDVVIGSWDAWQYLEASYFASCEPGTRMNVYYKNAAEGAQMALKNNIEGWPGLVDGNGMDYSYFSISAGDGSYSVVLDETLLTAMKGAGLIISGSNYTVAAIGLNAPAGPVTYDDTVIDFDDVDCGNWAGYQYFEPSVFATVTSGSKITAYYKNAAEGAQMAFKEPSDGWPGMVDGNGTDYSYFVIPAGDGHYTLNVDDKILTSLQTYGLVVGGHDYTIEYIVISIPAGGGAVEYDEQVLDCENTATGNWAAYKYFEPSVFASVSVGAILTTHYKDASGAQMAFKEPSDGWPGMVDENGTDYSYFVIPDGEGDQVLNVDAKILASLQTYGLVIGGHDYTIVSLTIKTPKPASAPAKNVIRIGRRGADVEYTFSSEGNQFNPVDALADGSWQNKVLKADLEKMSGYLKLLQDNNIPVLFRPLHEASGGWFWWGSKTGADFVALWKYVFDYLTGAGIHNLLWVWTSCLDDADWYPGDEYVDFIAYDWYPQSWEKDLYHTSGIAAWNALLSISNTKMLALGECGPMPGVGECLEDGAIWSWWMPWYGEHMAEPYNSDADFRSWMASSVVIALEESQVK